MSTTILNFKKVEVVAESKEAAIAQVESTLFHVNGDATQAYKNWKAKQTKGITERDVKEFMLEYLAKKGKNCPYLPWCRLQHWPTLVPEGSLPSSIPSQSHGQSPE